MRFSQASRAGLIIAALVASLMSWWAPSVANAAPDPARSSIKEACNNADFILISARGSGETGVGGTMWSVYTTMADHISRTTNGASKLNLVNVDYPARHVSSAALVAVGSNSYFDGIADGFVKTSQYLQQVQTLSECSHVTVFLGGFSQGAMVMHRIIQAYDPSQLARFHFLSAILVGDGDRVAHDGTHNFGNADPGIQGIGQAFPFLSASKPDPIDINNDTPVFSVCNAGDPVCALSVRIPPWCPSCAGAYTAAAIMRGIAVHTSYDRSAALAQAARAATFR